MTARPATTNLFRGRASERATRIQTWIDSFQQQYTVVDEVMTDLDVALGEPRLEYGPTYVRGRNNESPKVRIGAMWVVNEANVGFNVTFTQSSVEIEAHNAARRVHLRTSQSEVDILSRDLELAFELAGLHPLMTTTGEAANR